MRGLFALALAMMTTSAGAQYWGWQDPYSHPPPLHPYHPPHPYHGVHHPHQRSSEAWKQSIIRQGKQFCAANPRDSICPRR